MLTNARDTPQFDFKETLDELNTNSKWNKPKHKS